LSRIWYCPNCGYEVSSRGRCHRCREKLVASDLPELEVGEEDEEVGYRLGDWGDRDRGRLIEVLNDLEIIHRFEDDELVVAADDEATVDDLVGELSDEGDSGGEPGELGDLEAGDDGAGDSVDDEGSPGPTGEPVDPRLAGAIRLLADAAERLKKDPTDMHADADVAESSTAVFMADGYPGVAPDAWAAIGRVTRRLLGALGAEEALEEAIGAEASVLSKLLEKVTHGAGSSGGAPASGNEAEQTVYELPDWFPEQRAHLGVLLDQAGVIYEWDGDDLVVPADKEDDVEALFAEMGSGGEEDGGEGRYRAIEELFAAAGRLAGDPYDEQRAAAVVMWAHEAEGPAPLGMDEVHWLRIMSRTRALAEAIEGDLGADLIGEEASAPHGLLRTVV
jgi:hypothetical protein